MGFWGLEEKIDKKKDVLDASKETLHALQCDICPLNDPKLKNQHPHMKPTGVEAPIIYALGEAPGSEEDETGYQFVGASGRLLRRHIPKDWIDKIRWNNVVRTRPPGNRDPSNVEIECCFPAGTMVHPIGRIKTLYRRWYDGPLVTIKTRDGRVLSGTPNHPIFTVKGETALKDIKVGDYTFCAGAIDQDSSRAPNGYDKPTPIDEIFGTFFKPGEMKRVGSALDFHGDGIANGEVDVVRTDGHLRRNEQCWTPTDQQSKQFIFSFTNPASGLLVRSSALDADFGVLVMIAAGDTIDFGLSLHPGSHLLRHISDYGTISFQNFDNPLFANLHRPADFAGAFTVPIADDDLVCRQGPPTCFRPSIEKHVSTIAKPNLRFDQEPLDCSGISAGQSLEFGDTCSVPVKLDQIVSVETVSNFGGYVYNLETESHKYTAEGLLVSNCRPSIVADIERTQPEAIFGFGSVPLHWAVDPSSKFRGISKWNGKQVPVKIGNHTCWYFPLLHPAYVLYQQREKEESGHTDDTEFVLQLDLHRAFEALYDLPEPVVYTEQDLRKDLVLVTGENSHDAETVIGYLDQLRADKIAGLDYETNRERPYSEGAKILTVGLSGSEGSLAFALDHPESKWPRRDHARVRDAFVDFLLTTPCKKVAHNLAFEQEWSAFFFGREVIYAGSWGDSMAQAYVLDARVGVHSLDFLCLQHLGLHLKNISGLDRTVLEHAPLREVLAYNGLDGKAHRMLYRKQIGALNAAGLMPVYHEHMKRVPTMVLTQLKGVPVDQKTVKAFKRKYDDEIDTIEDEIRNIPEVVVFERDFGKKFNPASNGTPKRPGDLLQIIWKQWGLHGIHNVDEQVLEQIDHPLCKLILDWRGAIKNLSTYVEPLLIGSPLVYPDGLLHPNTSTMRTRTGRTSSDKPNIQNFPKHTNKGIRNQIKAPPGCSVASIDWAGIQARNIAMESLDKGLIDAFWNDYDIHTDWMQNIAEAYPSWVPGGLKALKSDKGVRKERRQLAKNLFVFPSFFGAQPKSISAQLKIPQDKVYRLQDQLWYKFPGVRKWQDRVKENYYATGYVTGLSGYRRPAPVAVNEMINSPIQADEALLVCDAMSRLSEMDDEVYQPNFEVHDDLTFVWETAKIEQYAEIVVREMTMISYDWINVPMAVEMSIGDSWGEMTEVAKYSSVEIWGHKR